MDRAPLPASAESWSTDSLRPREEPALDEARTHSALVEGPHGPGTARSRVRRRTSAPEIVEPDVLDDVVRRAREGDEEAFGELWRTLHPPLLRFLRVRGDLAPEDIASEAWLQAIRGLPDFRGNGREFRSWLFTVARNRAIDAARARARRPATPVAELADFHTDTAPSAETLAIDNDATERALALVATLPPAQAEIVMLRVVAGLDVADVAALVGKKPGTVRVAVHRALQALAGTVGPEIRAEVS